MLQPNTRRIKHVLVFDHTGVMLTNSPSPIIKAANTLLLDLHPMACPSMEVIDLSIGRDDEVNVSLKTTSSSIPTEPIPARDDEPDVLLKIDITGISFEMMITELRLDLIP
ncbi:hypothetical protein Bca101_071923 [Brassica carinata]